MRILLICGSFDPAGGKYLLAKGLQKAGHNARCIVKNPISELPTDIVYSKDEIERIDNLARTADVFMFFLSDHRKKMGKIDWNDYIYRKKVLFNPNSSGLEPERRDFYKYNKVKIWTFKADEMPYEDMEFCPVFLPISEEPYLPMDKDYYDELIVGQSPLETSRKNTAMFIHAMNELLEENDTFVPGDLCYMVDVITKTPKAQCLQQKRQWHVSFDNLSDGHEGMSGWESLSMGIPTMVNLDVAQRIALDKWFEGRNPFMRTEKVAHLKAHLKNFYLNREYLKDRSSLTRKLMEKYMNEERVLGRLLDIINDTKEFTR